VTCPGRGGVACRGWAILCPVSLLDARSSPGDLVAGWSCCNNLAETTAPQAGRHEAQVAGGLGRWDRSGRAAGGHQDREADYGIKGVCATVQERALIATEKRVKKLMREEGLTMTDASGAVCGPNGAVSGGGSSSALHSAASVERVEKQQQQERERGTRTKPVASRNDRRPQLAGYNDSEHSCGALADHVQGRYARPWIHAAAAVGFGSSGSTSASLSAARRSRARSSSFARASLHRRARSSHTSRSKSTSGQSPSGPLRFS